MPERDELDTLIDSALSAYAEPRPGLERRMLARISGEVGRSSRRRRFLLALAAPVVACLLLFSYLFVKAPHSQPGHMAYTPAQPSAAHVARTPVHEPAPKLLSTTSGRRANHHKERVPQNTIPRPKLDIFPTPHPLNPGEQALTSFAAQAPEADRKAFIEAQQQADAPLHIAAIHIKPLELPDEGKN